MAHSLWYPDIQGRSLSWSDNKTNAYI